MQYGHGDNGYQYGREIIADFSTNVWYGGEPAGLKEHLFGKWSLINKYPEVMAESLGKKAALFHGLDSGNIIICNGATESIYLIAQAYKQRKSGIVIPSFSEYEDACGMHEHSIHFYSPGELLRSPEDSKATDLLWIGNPGNPMGEVCEGLEALIRNNPQTLFIVDEAFIEFTFSVQSLVPLVNDLQNLIVLRSLTKSFAIPGLRLGYIIGHGDLIKTLQSLKLPWSVNAFALEAGAFIFDHYKENLIPLKQLLTDKKELARQLQEISVTVHSSHTHYFLCETWQGTAGELHRYLLDKFHILIRDASNFRGLGAKHFRLATLTPGQNQLLVTALKEWHSKE